MQFWKGKDDNPTKEGVTASELELLGIRSYGLFIVFYVCIDDHSG